MHRAVIVLAAVIVTAGMGCGKTKESKPKAFYQDLIKVKLMIGKRDNVAMLLPRGVQHKERGYFSGNGVVVRVGRYKPYPKNLEDAVKKHDPAVGKIATKQKTGDAYLVSSHSNTAIKVTWWRKRDSYSCIAEYGSAKAENVKAILAALEKVCSSVVNPYAEK